MIANSNFFGVGSPLLYGVAALLNEFLPGSSNALDERIIAFSTGVKKNGDEWEYIDECALPGCKNHCIPYSLQLTGARIGKMYQVSLASAS